MSYAVAKQTKQAIKLDQILKEVIKLKKKIDSNKPIISLQGAWKGKGLKFTEQDFQKAKKSLFKSNI